MTTFPENDIEYTETEICLEFMNKIKSNLITDEFNTKTTVDSKTLLPKLIVHNDKWKEFPEFLAIPLMMSKCNTEVEYAKEMLKKFEEDY